MNQKRGDIPNCFVMVVVSAHSQISMFGRDDLQGQQLTFECVFGGEGKIMFM